MPRQYQILYKRGLGAEGKMARLEPKTHAALYDKPEVTSAIAYMAANPATEMIGVRLEDEIYMVRSFTQDAEAPNSFCFSE